MVMVKVCVSAHTCEFVCASMFVFVPVSGGVNKVVQFPRVLVLRQSKRDVTPGFLHGTDCGHEDTEISSPSLLNTRTHGPRHTGSSQAVTGSSCAKTGNSQKVRRRS